MNPFCKTPFLNLDVHHIIHRSLGGEDQLWNLITLCHNCHMLVENMQLDIIDDILKYWIHHPLWRWQKSYDKIIKSRH